MNNITIIYIESTEETWGERWTTKPILGVECCPSERGWDPTLGYVLKNSADFVTETFSDSDLDIKSNGYRCVDEDAGVEVHGTVVVIPVRDMTDDEIENYEAARDRHEAEAAQCWAEDQAYERARELRG